MTRVQWSQIGSDVFEDMVATLICLLHPEAERIDGSGGDRGRDAQNRSFALAEEQRNDLFELKSFTGRVQRTQRRQVERSLERAADLSPTSWTLIVPVDPTPAELEWFDGLRNKYPFPLEWRGKTWLDAEMAKRPYLVRYFIERGADEAIRLLRDLKQEEAGLDRGVPDAIDRIQRITRQLNELDPYYRFNINVVDETTTIVVVPRYRQAVADRPILVNFRVSFPDSSEGAAAANEFQEAMDYGTAVTVPPEYIQEFVIDAPTGLGSNFSEGTISLLPFKGDPWRLNARLVVESADGGKRSLPIVFNQRTKGRKGIIARGSDAAGLVTVRFRLNEKTGQGKLDLSLSVPDEVMPSAALPSLRFLSLIVAPNILTLEIEGLTSPEHPIPPDSMLVPPELLDIIELMAQVQDETGTYFPFSDNLTFRDVETLRQANALLRGESVKMPDGQRVTLNLVLGKNWQMLSDALRGELRDYKLGGRQNLQVAGHALDLGETEIVLRSAEVLNRQEILSRAEPLKEGDEVSLTLGGDSSEAWLSLPRRQGGGSSTP